MNSENATRLNSILESTFDARTAAANIGDSATVAIVIAKAQNARGEIFDKRGTMLNAVAAMRKSIDERLYNELNSRIMAFSAGAIQVINAAEESGKESAAVNEIANLTF